MEPGRITRHVILPAAGKKRIKFTFAGRELEAFEGEAVSSALFANGIKIFSEHRKDASPQGIFCANGQCAQCTVIADGLPVKACVAGVREGMTVEPLKGPPALPGTACAPEFGRVRELEVDALIIGGGPAGLAAAAELGKLNVGTLVIDDKHKPGGKLVLQTHKFFGSVEDCYAGTRGIDIADKLENQLREYPSVRIWLNAACLAVFSDKKAGVLYGGEYYLIRPKALVSATGAREKTLAFPGSTLPGVYGAGAFQTLVNRDLVRPAERLFVVGGGNVGIIAAYHALQAGIKVVGLIEARPQCGGYKVHADKLRRLGVPIYTGHTIVRAEGGTELETVTIARADSACGAVPGTEKTFRADTLLIAVGLNPVDEFHRQALEAGMNAFVCGDAEEIAEASAAMFSGRIAAHKVLKSLGIMSGEVPRFWFERLEVLKSRPGKTHGPAAKSHRSAVYPVLHCRQEIPCDPCVTVCPRKSIKLAGASIMAVPEFSGDCIGCFKCLLICPGLAITLVDYRKDKNSPLVSVPFEIARGLIKKGGTVELADCEGAGLGAAEVAAVRDFEAENTLIISVRTRPEIADRIASVRLFDPEKPLVAAGKAAPALLRNGADPGAVDDSVIICRCERVSLGEIRRAIRSGVRDMNQLKAATRAGMGACGAKTCESLILSVFRSEGVDLKDVTGFSRRPLFMEAPLGAFAGSGCRTEDGEKTSWSGF